MSTEEEHSQLLAGTLPTQGPTYKVVLEVDGVKTRALIDHGPQISIVRQELLPIIREKHGWTVELTAKFITGQTASWSQQRSFGSNGCSGAETHNQR